MENGITNPDIRRRFPDLHPAFTKQEAAVEANLDQELEMPDLCRVVGASGRALRSLCQEQLGMSPQRFVAIRRMQRIRLALAASEHPSRTVTDIAMQFGIWELGRFAASYKSLFGEAPSATLRRPP